MVRFSWLSFLGKFRKYLSVALIFGIDLAQPHTLLRVVSIIVVVLYYKLVTMWSLSVGGVAKILGDGGGEGCQSNMLMLKTLL